jgi:raffinose/stachyose/melibiose transport system permease protein
VRFIRRYWVDAIALIAVAIVFLIPFAFIVVTAVKSRPDAAKLDFTLPQQWRVWDNVHEVLSYRDNMLVTALKNSLLLTVISVTAIVLLAAMVGFVAQRRQDGWSKAANVLVFSGLIIPPAVVPTIYVLDKVDLFKTLTGLIMVEIAITLPFGILLTRAFVANIPREIDEAAIIDGAGSLTLFFKVVLPLLRPVLITLIVTSSVAIYNDFVNPLYFTPGSDTTTVQLTLYNFRNQFDSQWNLLFMDVLIITIPPLLMFIFFNRKIVEGITAGAVKG